VLAHVPYDGQRRRDENDLHQRVVPAEGRWGQTV
jgi:hypothetical protein